MVQIMAENSSYWVLPNATLVPKTTLENRLPDQSTQVLIE
jgi:hypothetical protein